MRLFLLPNENGDVSIWISSKWYSNICQDKGMKEEENENDSFHSIDLFLFLSVFFLLFCSVSDEFFSFMSEFFILFSFHLIRSSATLFEYQLNDIHIYNKSNIVNPKHIRKTNWNETIESFYDTFWYVPHHHLLSLSLSLSFFNIFFASSMNFILKHFVIEANIEVIL